jgi:hypothetical protein
VGVQLTEDQRQVLVVVYRPFNGGSTDAVPATDRQIADEDYRSNAAVRAASEALPVWAPVSRVMWPAPSRR